MFCLFFLVLINLKFLFLRKFVVLCFLEKNNLQHTGGVPVLYHCFLMYSALQKTRSWIRKITTWAIISSYLSSCFLKVSH